MRWSVSGSLLLVGGDPSSAGAGDEVSYGPSDDESVVEVPEIPV
jgi:hypothetical protein